LTGDDVVQKLKRVGFTCLRHGWTLIAWGIVLLATVVTLLKFGLPYAQGYKTDIERLIADRYGAPVHIGQLSAGWQSGGPALLLQQIQVADSQQQPLLQIAETRVRLDFWGSLRSLSLKAEHFELSGLEFKLNSQQLLQQAPTKPIEHAADTAPLLNAVEHLLFRQLKNFTLVDSELTLQSQYTPDIIIAIKQLNWRNEGNRHQGSGEIAIAGVTTNTSGFILDLYGDTLATSSGQLYVSSSELDVLPWFEQLLPQSKKLTRASINVQAWGDIEQGVLTKLLLVPGNNRLVWQHEGKAQQLQIGHGQLIWQPTTDGWQLASTALQIHSADQSWHDFQLQLSRQQGSYRGSIQQLQLAVLLPLAQLMADDVSGLSKLLQYQLDGRLTQLSLQLDAQDWFVSGDFIDLTAAPVADTPGVAGLYGHFSASQDFVRLDVQGQDGALRWAGAFNQDTAYQSLQARLEAVQQQGQWRLKLPLLTLRQPELELDAEMELWLGPRPGMSLLAELRGVKVEQAQHYFPYRHMPKSVIRYLEPALISGDIPSARVLWHGDFADFPYADGQGKFQALADIYNAEFAFDVHWPALKQLDVELLFDNASMLISSQQGQLFEVPVAQGVQVSIPNLFQANDLWVDIQTQARAEQVTALMLASPLSESVGNTLDYLGVAGLVGAQVKLQIGLKTPGVVATGEVDFYSSTLDIRQPALAAEQLQGRLSFHNDQISSQQLWLKSHGLWLQTKLLGQQQQDAYHVDLTASGDAGADQLLALVVPDWQQFGQGRSNFDWQLALQLPKTGFSFQSKLLIDLAAAELALPAPYGKTAADGATLLAEVNGDQQGADLQLTYGDQLRLLGRYQQDTGQLSHVLLSLGQPTAQLSPGFQIELDLPQADFIPWFNLIQQQVTAAASDDVEPAQPFFPKLQVVHGRIGQLHLFDDVFLHQTRLKLTPAEQHWQLELAAKETKASIQLGYQLAEQGIKAEIEHLELVFADQAAKELADAELQAQLLLDPDSADKPDYAALEAAAFAALKPMPWLADLPPLEVHCQRCTIGHFRLGQVELESQSDGNQWQLTTLNTNYQGHRWQIRGQYLRGDGPTDLGVSSFDGELTTPGLGQLLQDYDISSSLSGSPAQLSFSDLRWQGTPFQFNRKTLDGAVQWQLGEGSLSEVSDGGARIFSLLSLDSLVRKLRLDFRDVFAKGFFFSKMTGTMTLQQGVSHTADTEVIGAAGDIQMQGYADLAARQLDYQMSFSPKVTSSIPVILAWMVNPVSGVAALALDEVFQSAEVISKINFTVTGDLANPVVTEVKRDSKKVPLPAELRAKTPAPPTVLPSAVAPSALAPSAVAPSALAPSAVPLALPAAEQPQPLPATVPFLPDRPMPEAAPVAEDDKPADAKPVEKPVDSTLSTRAQHGG
jgi:uncharacterized protein (TIGR02099 family)